MHCGVVRGATPLPSDRAGKLVARLNEAHESRHWDHNWHERADTCRIVDWLRCFDSALIEIWVQRRIVVHLELPVDFESFPATEQFVEMKCERLTQIVLLLLKNRQPPPGLGSMLFVSVTAHRLLIHVKQSQGKDRQSVDGAAGGFGVDPLCASGSTPRTCNILKRNSSIFSIQSFRF